MTNTTLNNALGVHEDSQLTIFMREATQLSRLSLIQKRVPKKIKEGLQSTLQYYNGRRKIRILDLDDILWAMRKAVRTNEAVHMHGGTVANCYGWRAYSTVALVFTIGNFLYIELNLISAKKGSTGFGRLSRFNRPGQREEFLNQHPTFGSHVYLLTKK